MDPLDNPVKDHGVGQMADRDVDDTGWLCHSYHDDVTIERSRVVSLN